MKRHGLGGLFEDYRGHNKEAGRWKRECGREKKGKRRVRREEMSVEKKDGTEERYDDERPKRV